MKVKPPESSTQAGAGCEPNTHKASFIERRLFYLKIKLSGFLQFANECDFALQLCYKGKQ